MLIIDGDGHFVEPADIWDTCADARHRAAIKDTMAVLLTRLGPLPKNTSPLKSGGLSSAGDKHDERDPAGWDGKLRLQMHDREGIHAAVLFPTLSLTAGAIENPEVALATAQAVNRWAAEHYAAAAPKELYVVATLPTQFPDLAAQELRRCVKEYGFVAGGIRPNPTVDGRLMVDPGNEIIWATAADLDVPMCIHNAFYTDRPQLGTDRVRQFLAGHAAIHPLESMMAFAALYETGVFDRHRGLRFGFMEAACGWAPFWLERLDEHYEHLAWANDPVPARKASDVFREQCIIGCEGEEHMVPYVQDMFGQDKVVWATDYPHFDTHPPFTADMLGRGDMSDAQKAAVMGGAAVGFYRLDVDAIRASRRARGAATD
ncbi:MAG: amidohydrolase family protein [Gammaproteobacteria bacterium]